MSINNMSFKDFMNLIKSRGRVNINGITYEYVDQGGQGLVYKNISNGTILKLFKQKLNKSIVNELVFMKMCKYALDKKYTPNLIEYYEDKYLDMNVVISMEKLDNTLEKWSKERKNTMEWTSMLFQLIQVTFTMNNMLFIKHNDMKPKNIMYKKLDNPVVYKYTINGKSYYVPILYLFKVIDFGHSQYDSNKNTTSIPGDLTQIFILYKREIVNELVNNTDINKLKQIATKSNEFSKYYENESKYLIKTFNNHPQAIKEKMFKKAVAYFIIEHNLVDISQYGDIVPDKIILNAMARFEKMNFTELLNDKLFNDYTNKIKHDKEFVIDTK